MTEKADFIKHGFGEGDIVIAENQYFKITVLDSETSFTIKPVNWFMSIWLKAEYFLIGKYKDGLLCRLIGHKMRTVGHPRDENFHCKRCDCEAEGIEWMKCIEQPKLKR